MKVSVSQDTKYFCITEAVALYLQKYVTYRKRKIFFGKQTIDELAELMKKHKNEKFLLHWRSIAPQTQMLKSSLTQTFRLREVNPHTLLTNRGPSRENGGYWKSEHIAILGKRRQLVHHWQGPINRTSNNPVFVV